VDIDRKPAIDAIVIGTGIAGIYALHKLGNELKLKVRGFEKGAGVGGTWFWNRYPGARSDTESFVYRYSFDQETYDGWNWTQKYASQGQMLAYLNAVVDRHGLRPLIRFNTRVVAATFDEARGVWAVETSDGEVVEARYLVTSVGVLSKLNKPDLPGLDRFEGRQVHTGAWPDDLSLEGRKVGVIGTGSTGVQFIPAAAAVAGHLTVFQRSAQYCVPAGNDQLSPDFIREYRANFGGYWDQLRQTRIACGFAEAGVAAMSVSAEERTRVFQEHWDAGNGFRFMFGTFCDIAIDPAANEAACDFIREKIATIVTDPATAAKLSPREPYAKRPVCADGYYETYNRPNVELVDLKANPIAEVNKRGVRTADGKQHDLDVLVYATGFECVEGSYREMRIAGRDGKLLVDHWGDRPCSYLGISVHGFPNLFMVLGPNSVFSNLAPAIETQVDWIAHLVGRAEQLGQLTVDTDATAEDEWTVQCEHMAAYTLFPQVKSWIFGANIEGRPNRVLFFFGGLAAYREKLAEIVSSGYAGYSFAPAAFHTPLRVPSSDSVATPIA